MKDLSGSPCGRLFMAALAAVAIAPPSAVEASEIVLFRIFLKDGTTLVSYGEYARVADRVVFSMPLDPDPPGLRLQLATVPDAQVDWPRTEAYTTGVRRLAYEATRAEADFAAMTEEVAGLLTRIRSTADPLERLELAGRAQRQLAEWPRAHYGYRYEDVREIAHLLDEAISGLRGSPDGHTFNLSLVAVAPPPPPVRLLPRPTLVEAVEQALTVSRLTPDPAERVSLLRAAVAVIDARPEGARHPRLETARLVAETVIAFETRVDQAYAEVTRSMLVLAEDRAARADVTGVAGVLKQILGHDDRLGRRRPQVVVALIEAVEVKLEAARQLRREREEWERRVPAFRAYRRSIAGPLQQLGRVDPVLRELRQQGRPGAAALGRAIESIDRALQQLAGVGVPEELQPVHALLTSAFQLARGAARLRHDDPAPESAARDASSAAAGSRMLAERARHDLDRFLTMPTFR